MRGIFGRLRLQLTAICTFFTAVILLGMAFGALWVSLGYLERLSEEGFSTSLNSVMLNLQGVRVVDHSWLAQTEESGNLLLYLESDGVPLQYQGSRERERRPELFAQLEAQARELGLDLSQRRECGLQPRVLLSFSLQHQGERYYAAAAEIPAAEGCLTLLALQPQAGQQRQAMSLTLAFLGLSVLAAGALGVFAWLFTGRAIRPVREAYRRQAEFVSAASHELRSPLAVIRSTVPALEQASPERAARFRETIGQECDRMSRLVGDLLMLAAADNQSWSIQREDTDPQTLLLDSYEAFELTARQKGLRLRLQLPEEELPVCRCDGHRVRQVLSILLDNAISYTPPEGVITLWVRNGGGGLQFGVSDNGPGIPPELRERVFDRFYRADAPRSQKGHYGLGLSIAQEIAQLHRGRLRVEETPGGGATFVLWLPL